MLCEGRVLGEINLEADKREHRILKNVASGDSLLIKAARSSFEIVFAGVDETDRLECMVFNSGCYNGTFHLRTGESSKACGGTLMEFTLFSVTVERGPVQGDEAMANVLVQVKLEDLECAGRFAVPGLRLVPGEK